MANLLLLLLTIFLIDPSRSFLLSKRKVLGNDINNGVTPEENRSWVTVHALRSVIEAIPGEVVEVECEASGSPQPLVRFYNDVSDLSKPEVFTNEIAEYTSTSLIKAKAKFRLVVQKSQVIFCKAFNGGKFAHAAIKVSVLHGAKMSYIANNEVLAYEDFTVDHQVPMITFFDAIYLDNFGSTVILPCHSTGGANTVWLQASGEAIVNGGRDGKITVMPSGDLRLENIDWSDMGAYTCVVSNVHGKDSAVTFLYPMLA